MRKPAPSAAAIVEELRELVSDAIHVVYLYRRLEEYGYEPTRRSDGVPVAGGDVSDVPLHLVENADRKPADIYERNRRRARYIGEQVRTARMALGNARAVLRKYVEPGYPQPTRDRARSVVTSADWQAALERQASRKARGQE